MAVSESSFAIKFGLVTKIQEAVFQIVGMIPRQCYLQSEIFVSIKNVWPGNRVEYKLPAGIVAICVYLFCGSNPKTILTQTLLKAFAALWTDTQAWISSLYDSPK